MDGRLFKYDYKFQFTHPVWGATTRYINTYSPSTVSIHAPRVGCDRGYRYADSV